MVGKRVQFDDDTVAGRAVARQTGKSFQLKGQREATVGQLSRSYRGEENGEVEVTGFGP